MKKFFIFLLLILTLLVSCEEPLNEVTIVNGESIVIEIGQSVDLDYLINFETINEPIWTTSKDIVTVDDSGNVTAIKEGTTSISAKYGDQEVNCIVRCIWY